MSKSVVEVMNSHLKGKAITESVVGEVIIISSLMLIPSAWVAVIPILAGTGLLVDGTRNFMHWNKMSKKRIRPLIRPQN